MTKRDTQSGVRGKRALMGDTVGDEMIANDLAARIYVVGIGGSGNSAINRMIQNKIRGVHFVAINTDAQALALSNAAQRIHIGRETTRGLGAGMDPEVGRAAALEDETLIREALEGADMVFLTCGTGGGTGSGVTPVVADIAKEMGALTVGVVTKPFTFEGMQRRRIADDALEELIDRVDTLITIPNDKVLHMIDRKTSLTDAFKIVDDVLRQGVQGISDIITKPGMVNVDFADVNTIMRDAGSSLMGIGYGSGDDRAKQAAEMAISSPLLDVTIEGARGVLFAITGGNDLGMMEVQEAADIITANIDTEAKVIFGAVSDPSLGDELQITVVATGFQQPGITSGKKRAIAVGDIGPGEEEVKKSSDEQSTADISEDKNNPPESFMKAPSQKREPDITQPSPDDVEDEFDIPAFLRKKMK